MLPSRISVNTRPYPQHPFEFLPLCAKTETNDRKVLHVSKNENSVNCSQVFFDSTIKVLQNDIRTAKITGRIVAYYTGDFYMKHRS